MDVRAPLGPFPLLPAPRCRAFVCDPAVCTLPPPRSSSSPRPSPVPSRPHWPFLLLARQFRQGALCCVCVPPPLCRAPSVHLCIPCVAWRGDRGRGRRCLYVRVYVWWHDPFSPAPARPCPRPPSPCAGVPPHHREGEPVSGGHGAPACAAAARVPSDCRPGRAGGPLVARGGGHWRAQ